MLGLNGRLKETTLTLKHKISHYNLQSNSVVIGLSYSCFQSGVSYNKLSFCFC